MKTSLLQSLLARNARDITKMSKLLSEVKADGKAAQLEQSRKYARKTALKLSVTIRKIADIQRELKRDLLAAKFARPSIFKKHGKDDVRYTMWVEKQQAAERSGENYKPVEFFPPKDSAISCSC